MSDEQTKIGALEMHGPAVDAFEDLRDTNDSTPADPEAALKAFDAKADAFFAHNRAFIERSASLTDKS